MGDQQNVKKIIITGYKGYIGRKLVKELKNEKNIKLIIFKKNLLQKKNIKNLNKFNDYTLLHLAGYVPKKIDDYKSNKNDLNIKIFENILKSHINKIYLISTYAVFGNDNIINEKIPTKKNILNKYSKSKLIVEKMALKSDKEIIILRIPGIFGYPRKSGLIYNIISKLIKRKEPKINKDLPQIIIMHLRSLIIILVKLLQKNFNYKKYKIVNINYPKNTNINNIIKFIFKNMGKKSKKINCKKIRIHNNNFNNFNNLFKNKIKIEEDILFEISVLKKRLKKA